MHDGRERAYALAERVAFDDYLVRNTATHAALAALAAAWPGMPAALRALAALSGAGVQGYADYRVWVPASVALPLYGTPTGHGLVLGTRQHPYTPPPGGAPWYGHITRAVQLQDGERCRPTGGYADSYAGEQGAEFLHAAVQGGYQVAYSLHRRPVHVLPSMVRPAPA